MSTSKRLSVTNVFQLETLRMLWAVFGQHHYENETKTKLVESISSACLDAGSNPADSTILYLKHSF